MDVPCFSEVRSLNSWCAVLLLFFFKHVSISPALVTSLVLLASSFLLNRLVFLYAFQYSFAPAKYRLFFKSLLSSQRSRTSLVGGGGSGSAMMLGKLPVPGRPTKWITVGQRPTALA